MSKRLILGSLVITGLVAVALWLQVTAAAQAESFPDAPFETSVEEPLIEVVVKDTTTVTPGEETAPKEAPKAIKSTAANADVPYFGPQLKEGTAWVEEALIETDGTVRKVKAARDAKELRERYLEFHRRIAERFTAEQLAEKCNALDRELNELLAEDEIEQIQKELSELKQKNSGHKGISNRVQRAIDALRNSTSPIGPPTPADQTSESFMPL